jgi:hypothetical protein
MQSQILVEKLNTLGIKYKKIRFECAEYKRAWESAQAQAVQQQTQVQVLQRAVAQRATAIDPTQKESVIALLTEK